MNDGAIVGSVIPGDQCMWQTPVSKLDELMENSGIISAALNVTLSQRCYGISSWTCRLQQKCSLENIEHR